MKAAKSEPHRYTVETEETNTWNPKHCVGLLQHLKCYTDRWPVHSPQWTPGSGACLLAAARRSIILLKLCSIEIFLWHKFVDALFLSKTLDDVYILGKNSWSINERKRCTKSAEKRSSIYDVWVRGVRFVPHGKFHILVGKIYSSTRLHTISVKVLFGRHEKLTRELLCNFFSLFC
jgi:hypothetical protein